MRDRTPRLLRITLFALFVIVTAVYPLAGMETVTEILAGTSFTSREADSIRAIFESAEARGIPEELLVPRLQEGVAKQVPGARLSQALERNVEILDSIRRLANSVAGGDELIEDASRWQRAATVLQAGYSESELRMLLEATVERPDLFRPATTLYISVRDWGLESLDAARIVTAAVQSSVPTTQYPGIAEILALARRARIRPADAIERIVTALPRVGSVGELRDRVIE